MLLRRAALLASTFAAVAALTACGGSGGEAAGGRRLAVIPKGTSHEFWKAVHAGSVRAGDDLGVQIQWVGPQPEGDREAQIGVMETMITRGVDGIVLMPVDGTALARVAEEAQQAGIPVVIADSGLEWEGQVSFVATDNREAGRIAGRRLRALMGGAGKAVMMRYVEGSESTKQREDGFLEGVAEQPGVALLSTNQHAGNTKEGAQAVAENLLTAHPDVTGVFCSNESATHGMLRALEAAGLAGKVRFVGFDSSGTLLEGLRQGHIDALVLQDPVHMGDTAVRTLVGHLDGERVDRRVDTGVTVATKDNLDSAEIAGLLTPDLSILDGR
jgi:ribose transport system substrate-binding protein